MSGLVEMGACPECGRGQWSTASDGLGSVASVAAECVNCGYVTTSVVDLDTPPAADPSVGEGGAG